MDAAADRNTSAVKIRRLLALVFLLLTSSLAAQDRIAAEEQLRKIQQDIEVLQQALERARTDHAQETGNLQELDLAIAENARELASAVSAIERQREEVSAIEQRQADYLAELGSREQALGEQLLAAWKMSRESRLKLILNQDSPAQLNRLLAYYDHLSAAQSADISELRDVVQTLAGLRMELDRELISLAAIQEQHAGVETRLQEQRAERLELLQALEAGMNSDETRIEELTRNRRDLETLIERLDDALADIPADMGGRKHPTQLRGELPMPVQGRVIKAFGQPRGAGLRWQGWMISAPSGEVARAVAYGRVAYADWLRGYGLLLIVDHGEGFMSLYGQNESLTVEVGDWVEPAQDIARIGQNDAQQQGLYFELRNEGKALDPAVWVRR